ncbi:MAG: hypothetical protein HY868_21080 [Chloroflexi bacterium]|nr:hypothetical protein [Chloroflexota bacterium]
MGAATPTGIAVFNAAGHPIADPGSYDFLIQVYPEIGEFSRIIAEVATQTRIPKSDVEEIVEVKGSSACFEYQFPASPQYFVGRQSVLAELDGFISQVINKETSSRGILFEANSGWGKSSTILASVSQLTKAGHFAVAVDSRTASSSQFILRVVDYAIKKFGDFNGVLDISVSLAITGFEGAVSALLTVGKALELHGQVMVIFLDQFENVFFLPDVLRRIRDLFLKVSDAQSGIVFGFSWKTDLIGLPLEFPYELHSAITDSSKLVTLDTFSEKETQALLRRLSNELHARLRKDLEFFLSDFSQGYPWLLKKLCAHVKAQREAGVLQSDIANSLLNVEELFQEDLRGLSAEQDDTLHRIAKSAPVSISELGEEFKPEIVQSLVHRRLVVRIGNKYDIYWDIFRDYLNTRRVPIQENYMLRAQTGGVLKAIKLLVEAHGESDKTVFLKRAGLTEQSFYNLAQEMKLLGLAKIDGGKIKLQVQLPKDSKDFDQLRAHLRDRLPRNRLVWQLKETLEKEGTLTIVTASDLLAKWCPYVSANDKTWQSYARIFADWMDFADLAIFDSKSNTLARYRPGTEVREHRRMFTMRSRAGIAVPLVQYSPIEKVAIKLVHAAEENRRLDWAGMKPSTIAKSLTMLESLGFISRQTSTITVMQKLRKFVSEPEKRPGLFAESALRMHAFDTFVQMLNKYKDTGRPLAQLAEELRNILGADWKDATVETNVKIMLDWARHTQLAPGVFARVRRGGQKHAKKSKDQASLFKIA